MSLSLRSDEPFTFDATFLHVNEVKKHGTEDTSDNNVSECR
jgi:hypothetical protein